MDDSKLLIRLQDDRIQLQYKADNILPKTVLEVGSYSYKRAGQKSQYEALYTFSKKMRQTIRQSINTNNSFIKTYGPLTIACRENKITIVYKDEIKMSKLKKIEDGYDLKIQVQQLQLLISFTNDFFNQNMKAHSTKTQTKTTIDKKDLLRHTAIAKKQTKATAQEQKKNGKRYAPSISSIWAPDGSLLKKTSPSDKKKSTVYKTASESRNCGKCFNLSKRNYCAVQKTNVQTDHVCSRFYRYTEVLGGGVNPR